MSSYEENGELLNSYSGQPLYSFTVPPGGLPAASINQTPASQRRASKASVQAMPKVIVAHEEAGNECSICLNGLKSGDEVKEMPCKHIFHGGCIEKWMGMSTLCPLCRFSLPTEPDDEQNSDYNLRFNGYPANDYGSDTECDSENEEDAGGEWDTSTTVDVDGFTIRFSLDINEDMIHIH